MFVKAYRFVVDHLTKAIGIIGASLMSVLAYLDPVAIRQAAQTYLGDHAAEKMGGMLFTLVIVRGYFTGRKQRAAAQALADAQAALQAAQAKATELAAKSSAPVPGAPS